MICWWSLNFPTYVFSYLCPIDSSIISKQQNCSWFYKEGNFLNNFFATQCKPLIDSSVLPSTISSKTHIRLNSISFEKEDILKIIRNLNVNKWYFYTNVENMWFWSSSTPITYLWQLHKFWNFHWYMEEVLYHSNIFKKKMINILLTVTVLFLYYQF